jgi:hypothetical protein
MNVHWAEIYYIWQRKSTGRDSCIWKEYEIEATYPTFGPYFSWTWNWNVMMRF